MMEKSKDSTWASSGARPSTRARSSRVSGATTPAAVSSASLDRWADPYSQQLCCAAASPAWELHGLRGFVGTESPAAVGAAYLEGHVAYHLRGGLHYLSRQDWLFYMDFVRRHKGKTV